MRQVGRLSSTQEAEVFQDYLLTLGIQTTVDAPRDEGVAVWVHDEDRVQQSRDELEAFRADPEAAKYRDSRKRADAIRDQIVRQSEAARKNRIEGSRTWSNGPSNVPVTIGLLVMAFVVTMAISFGKRLDPVGYWLMLTKAAWTEGQVWRFVTPIFLHFDILHLLFNLYWTWLLGSIVERRLGARRYIALILLMSAIPNFAQYWHTGSGFGGLSGVGYGLFGYLWMKSRFDPNSGIYLPPNIVFMFIIFLFLGMTGGVGGVANNIANIVHVGGLLVGLIVGYWSKFTRDLQHGGR